MNADLAKSLSSMSWRNLRRNVRRNLATGIAITAGFTAFLLAAGYANRVDNVLSRYTIYGLKAGHITIVRKGALEMYAIKPRLWSLNTEDQTMIENTLKSTGGIDAFGAILTGQGIIGNGCKTFPFLATGVEPEIERYSTTHPELIKWAPHIGKTRVGTPIWEYNPNETPITVSSGLARLLGKTKMRDQIPAGPPQIVTDCKASDVIEQFSKDANVQLASGTWDGQLNAIDGDLVQTFKTGLIETNNASVTLGLKQLQSLYNTDHVTSYSIWLKNPEELTSKITALRSALVGSKNELEILPWNNDRIGPYYVGTMRFIYTMVSFIGFVLALVIVLSIFNSATMTVIERSEEIGMLRSLGYTRRLIRIIFALEGFFLTLVSTVAGIVFGLIAMYAINKTNFSFSPPGVEEGLQLILVPSLSVIVAATICVSSLGLIATWLAVANIARKNISELVAGTHR